MYICFSLPSGLPEEFNTEEFKLVCKRCHDLNPEPMTFETALLSIEEQVC